MFRDREDAGDQLAQRLQNRTWHKPLVLAIPRGGVIIGAALARKLHAELDVVLSRKLRAPHQPELALGAVAEDGRMVLNSYAEDDRAALKDYLEKERTYQLGEIARRKKLFRAVRPQAVIEGRCVIVTDDGIATGSTMIAALQTIRRENPRELVAAVPVAAPDRLDTVRPLCDEVVCLLATPRLFAIGPCYDDFRQIDDDQAVALLRTIPFTLSNGESN